MQEVYKKFMHLSNDVSWCSMLFASSNAAQKAKQILRKGLSKNAHDLIEILPSIPSDGFNIGIDAKIPCVKSCCPVPI